MFLFFFFQNSIGKQMEYHQFIKPLDQNKISRIGRVSRKAIFYSFELPFDTQSSIEYSSTLQLYFINDPRQSIIYRSGMFKPPSPIAVDFFLPINTSDSVRSLQILLENICPMYIEAKVMIYDDDLDKVDRFCFYFKWCRIKSISFFVSCRKSSHDHNVILPKIIRLNRISATDDVRSSSRIFNPNIITRWPFVQLVR